SAYSTTANKSGRFVFTGIASHAAQSPERGRSALDAVEAMNFMVNLMRPVPNVISGPCFSKSEGLSARLDTCRG
ncbi:MAG: hypothetical protein AAF399_19465, partial [Bacteroidota bacterium]